MKLGSEEKFRIIQTKKGDSEKRKPPAVRIFYSNLKRAKELEGGLGTWERDVNKGKSEEEKEKGKRKTRLGKLLDLAILFDSIMSEHKN